MTPLEIPIIADVPLFEIRTTLDGREFLLLFDWNDRESRWYLSIESINHEQLARGIKLLSNRPLLRKKVDPRLPSGSLVAIDTTETGVPAGFADLGSRVRLIYFEVGNG